MQKTRGFSTLTMTILYLNSGFCRLSSAFPLMGVPACVFFGWLIDRYDRRRNGEILAVSLTLLLIIMGLLCGWLWKPLQISGVPAYVVVAVLCTYPHDHTLA